MSRQARGISARILEVDEYLRKAPRLRARIREVHPEVCFYQMAGGKPCLIPKRKEAGLKERCRLLAPAFKDLPLRAIAESSTVTCAADDILDAFAALWTAERIAAGEARTIPISPPVDAFGLRMEIVV